MSEELQHLRSFALRMARLVISRLLLAVVGILLALEHETRADPSKIDPKLSALLEKGEKVNVIVSFRKGIRSTLDTATAVRHGSREARNKAIKAALEENADSSQGGVRHLLAARSGGTDSFQYVKHYWAVNKMFIKQASAEVVKQVAEDPEVLKIVVEPILEIPKWTDEAAPVNAWAWEKNWGLDRIQAAEAWEELGSRGEGIVVGSIDSGVRYTHEALRDNFVGIEYGWVDALNNKTEPYDTSGHGTHTMGILAGSREIGVVPGAKWMTCKACDGGCPGEALLDCIQWMCCPTLPDGSKPDCTKAPHVLSNSWTSDRGITDYNEDIMGLKAMGIIPVFAIGNSFGGACKRTCSPGEQSIVIGVGSVSKKMHDTGSAVGPAADGSVKPDIVAPGSGITSSVLDSDHSYWSKSGTSMATPHVAGVIALLKVRNPELSYDEAYDLITRTADRNVTLNPYYLDRYCNLSTPDVIPNIFFGYGTVNALSAVRAQTELLKGAPGGRK